MMRYLVGSVASLSSFAHQVKGAIGTGDHVQCVYRMLG
jgi:hypothetical protein